MISFRSKTKGVPELVKAIAEIDKKVARKALRQAVQEATAPILKDAKSLVPVETKTLKKALGRKAKAYKGGLAVVGIVGVRKDKKGKPIKHKRKVGQTKGGKAIYRNPLNYAHLVEFGHRIAKGGGLRNKYTLALTDTGKKTKSGKAVKRWKRSGIKEKGKGVVGGAVPPRPFLRPALDRNREQIPRTMTRVLQIALAGLSRGAIARG